MHNREHDQHDVQEIKQSNKVWNATNDHTEQDQAQLNYDRLFTLTTEQPKPRYAPVVQVWFCCIVVPSIIVLLLIWFGK